MWDKTVRLRLNRIGNRQLNRMLCEIALPRDRAETQGRADFLRKRAEGKANTEALRCLKRRISDVVFLILVGEAPTVEPRDSAGSAAAHRVGAQQESTEHGNPAHLNKRRPACDVDVDNAPAHHDEAEKARPVNSRHHTASLARLRGHHGAASPTAWSRHRDRSRPLGWQQVVD